DVGARGDNLTGAGLERSAGALDHEVGALGGSAHADGEGEDVVRLVGFSDGLIEIGDQEDVIVAVRSSGGNANVGGLGAGVRGAEGVDVVVIEVGVAAVVARVLREVILQAAEAGRAHPQVHDIAGDRDLLTGGCLGGARSDA